MSDFLLIVPQGWTELPAVAEEIGTSVPVEQVTFQIAQEAWGDIETMLISMGQLPDGKNVVSARLINADNGYRFWVQFTA